MLPSKLSYLHFAAQRRRAIAGRVLLLCLVAASLSACSDDSSSDSDAHDDMDASTQEPSPADPSPAMDAAAGAEPMDTPPQPSSAVPNPTPMDDAGHAETDAGVSVDGGVPSSLPDASVSRPDAATLMDVEAGTARDAGEPEPASRDASMPSLDAGTEADASAPEVKRVFATSLRYNAALGGPDGADALCASHAAGADLPGEYKAWLSTSTVSVTERLAASSLPYARLDGVLVARGFDDLLDGTLLAPINVDEFAAPASGDVWTGTLPDGTGYAPNDCNGFDSDTGSFALCGSTVYLDSRWTQNLVPACSTQLRLFCFEQ